MLSQISIPWVDISFLRKIFNSSAFDFYNMLTGGGMENFSIFSLSISPYITASIVLQLLTILMPSLETLQKDGETGKRILTKYTQRLSLLLSIIQAFSISIVLKTNGIIYKGWFPIVSIILTLVAGSSILLWFANRITENGLGNGVSLILLLNVLTRVPNDFYNLYKQFVKNKGFLGSLSLFLIIGVFILIIFFTIILNGMTRKIPIQYSNKIKGRKKDESIPLKINTGNVMPVIFASSVLSLPVVINAFLNKTPKGILKPLYYSSIQNNWFVPSMWKLTFGYFIYLFLLIYFAYFYTEISFNPKEIADNFKRTGASIPEVRSGKETEEYLKKILNPVILIGAISLGIVCTIPMLFSGLFNAQVSFSGTSLIIVVSVLIETVNQSKIYFKEDEPLLFKV